MACFDRGVAGDGQPVPHVCRVTPDCPGDSSRLLKFYQLVLRSAEGHVLMDGKLVARVERALRFLGSVSQMKSGFRVLRNSKQLAAVYFSGNLPGNLVEFGLNAPEVARVLGKDEREVSAWIGEQAKRTGLGRSVGGQRGRYPGLAVNTEAQLDAFLESFSALQQVKATFGGSVRAGTVPEIESVRIEKAANDAGFDLTREQQGSWTIFRSTAFPVWVGISVQDSGTYRLGLSDAAIGLRLGAEFGLVVSAEAGPWAAWCDGIQGYSRLHGILLRVASISRVLHQAGLREFVAKKQNPPSSTEAVREVVQRVGQDIFRRTLIDYWGGRCAVTGLDVVEVLRASHIKPWADCENDAERLDVFNGLLLAPHLDALFDRGLVTVSDEGQLLRSPQLSDRQWALLGIGGVEARADSLADGHRKYLAWHRAKVFRGDAPWGTGAQ